MVNAHDTARFDRFKEGNGSVIVRKLLLVPTNLHNFVDFAWSRRCRVLTLSPLFVF